MKKHNVLFILALLTAWLAFGAAVYPAFAAEAPTRTVLAVSTEDGITTTKFVGRVQGEPANDGTLTLTVYPLVVLTLAANGKQIGDSKLDTSASFTITLSAAQYGGLSTLVKAAFDAKVAAEAAAANP